MMKNLSMSLIGATLLAFGTLEAAIATSFISTSSGQIGTIDSSTATFDPIFDTPPFLDIGINSQNDLFGVASGSLYSVDLNTQMTAFIGNTEASLNSLGFDDTDVLYGTGSNGFYTIDLATGAASLVSNISGFNSSGDLAYDSTQEQFFATSGDFNPNTTDLLWSIQKDGTATFIGELGFGNVFGLFFENDTLLGYTENRQQIFINPITGAGTLAGTVTGGTGLIFGAASSSSPTTAVAEPASVLGLMVIGVLGCGGLLKRKLS